MIKHLKALVNGKEVLVKAVKSYHNGIQEVFEGTMEFNSQQVSVAVAASEIIADVTPKARLKAEYKGDRENKTCRVVEITITAKRQNQAEAMLKMLDDFLSEKGYELNRCSQVEEHNESYIFFDFVAVENRNEGKAVLRLYKQFKKLIQN